MEIAAFLVALVAAVVFLVSYGRTRDLAHLGLAVLTVAWILQSIVNHGTFVHLG